MSNKINISLATLLLAFFSGLTLPAQAQYRNRDYDYRYGRNSRVQNLADDLNARVQHIWSELQNTNYNPNRSGTSSALYMAISNLANSTKLYADRLAGYGSDSSVQGARRIIRLAQRVDRLMARTDVPGDIPSDWAGAQERISDLAGMYNLDYSPSRELARRDYGYGRDDGYYGNDGYYRDNPYSGGNYFRWQGYVDGSDIIRLSANRVMIQHLEANPIQGASFDMSSALPRSPVTVSLTNVQGRGTVRLVEQPSASNGYSAAVRIDDPKGGAEFYSFQLRW